MSLFTFADYETVEDSELLALDLGSASGIAEPEGNEATVVSADSDMCESDGQNPHNYCNAPEMAEDIQSLIMQAGSGEDVAAEPARPLMETSPDDILTPHERDRLGTEPTMTTSLPEPSLHPRLN